MKNVIEIVKRLAVLLGLTIGSLYGANYIWQQGLDDQHQAWQITMIVALVIGVMMLAMTVMLLIKIINQFLQWSLGVNFR